MPVDILEPVVWCLELLIRVLQTRTETELSDLGFMTSETPEGEVKVELEFVVRMRLLCLSQISRQSNKLSGF